MQRAGISILGNYMFGFPEDTYDTMWETFLLAKELNCEYSNFYCMVAYPGTEMVSYANKQGWQLPTEYSAYSQYSYDFLPLPTHALTASQVLSFRDYAWRSYHNSDKYLDMMEEKFGTDIRDEITTMIKIPLKRKLLEDQTP